MTKDTNTKTRNNLRQARQRSGLERKQVALLLGKKSSDEYLRHENGKTTPSLQTALKMEIIFRMPIHLLFQEFYDEYQSEITNLRKAHAQLFGKGDWYAEPEDQLKHEEFCFYSDLVRGHVPSDLEIKTITKHLLALNSVINKLRDERQQFLGK